MSIFFLGVWAVCGIDVSVGGWYELPAVVAGFTICKAFSERVITANVVFAVFYLWLLSAVAVSDADGIWDTASQWEYEIKLESKFSNKEKFAF